MVDNDIMYNSSIGMSSSIMKGLGLEDFLVDDGEFDDISEGVFHGHVQHSVTVTQIQMLW